MDEERDRLRDEIDELREREVAVGRELNALGKNRADLPGIARAMRVRAEKAEAENAALRDQLDVEREALTFCSSSLLAVGKENEALKNSLTLMTESRDTAEAEWDRLRIEAENSDYELGEALNRLWNLERAGSEILREPYGCMFCDSGRLRTRLDGATPRHTPECGFALLVAALAEPVNRPAEEER